MDKKEYTFYLICAKYTNSTDYRILMAALSQEEADILVKELSDADDFDDVESVLIVETTNSTFNELAKRTEKIRKEMKEKRRIN